MTVESFETYARRTFERNKRFISNKVSLKNPNKELHSLARAIRANATHTYGIPVSPDRVAIAVDTFLDMSDWDGLSNIHKLPVI
jgi:hypothetical protein